MAAARDRRSPVAPTRRMGEDMTKDLNRKTSKVWVTAFVSLHSVQIFGPSICQAVHLSPTVEGESAEVAPASAGTSESFSGPDMVVNCQ